jgi:acyl-CoA thioester hydrolase
MLTHRTQFRVIYGDTDSMGVAYYANYLRWFEIGRTELFRSLGLPYTEIEKKGYFLPVSETHCKFKTFARYDDVMTIETSYDETIKAGLKFNYLIFKDNENEIFAKGYTRHAFLDSTGKLVRTPKFIREFIAEKIGER